MFSFFWDEDEQRVVSTEGSDDESDSPSPDEPTKPLAAWETVNEDEVEKSQAAHTFDLSTLFNFSPRNGNCSGSGYDDQISFTAFATGTSKLTVNIGSFQDPILWDNKEVVVDDNDTSMLPPPVARIPASSSGAAFSMSFITSDSLQSLPGEMDSVSSAPPSIKPRSNSQALSPTAATGVQLSPLAASATSL